MQRSQPTLDGQAWATQMAHMLMKRHPLLSRRWHYEPGVALTAIKHLWLKTRDDSYLEFIKRNIDECVGPDGSIRTYRLEEYNLDQINEGKLLFLLFDVTGNERYRKAAYVLREQLRTHPRTTEGGFWHKQVYPFQMWLDGIYMAAPFYAEFAKTFDEPDGFDDVAHQIILIESHARDTETGLLYHGWDESRKQQWADPKTGCSRNFWGRATGWFAMAIPDVLDHFPQDHPARAKLVSMFQNLISAVAAVQDSHSGVWYQVLDQGDREGNYLESSASCMFAYAISKGARMGYIDPKYLDVAQRAFGGILTHFVRVDEQGFANLEQICAVGGLGGRPYRDGSFEYYVQERVVANDFKGVGPLIMAGVEMGPFYH